MATIQKARNNLIYALAIVIGVFFSFIGKPSPTWAQDAKKTHNAKIFNESFFGLNDTNNSGTLLAQSNGNEQRVFSQPSEREFTQTSDRQFTQSQRVFSKDENRSFTKPTEMRIFSAPAGRSFTIDRVFSAPEQAQSVNTQLDEMMKAIQAKVQGNDPLTPGEMALLVEMENSRRIETIGIILDRKNNTK